MSSLLLYREAAALEQRLYGIWYVTPYDDPEYRRVTRALLRAQGRALRRLLAV